MPRRNGEEQGERMTAQAALRAGAASSASASSTVTGPVRSGEESWWHKPFSRTGGGCGSRLMAVRGAHLGRVASTHGICDGRGRASNRPVNVGHAPRQTLTRLATIWRTRGTGGVRRRPHPRPAQPPTRPARYQPWKISRPRANASSGDSSRSSGPPFVASHARASSVEQKNRVAPQRDRYAGPTVRR